jgi:hypothetical protein
MINCAVSPIKDPDSTYKIPLSEYFVVGPRFSLAVIAYIVSIALFSFSTWRLVSYHPDEIKENIIKIVRLLFVSLFFCFCITVHSLLPGKTNKILGTICFIIFLILYIYGFLQTTYYLFKDKDQEILEEAKVTIKSVFIVFENFFAIPVAIITFLYSIFLLYSVIARSNWLFSV